MTARTRARAFAATAALAAVALIPAAASAGTTSVVAGDFSNGAGGWTSTASCTLLCTVTNTTDASSGGAAPGSAQVAYATLVGLAGLATGTSTLTSPPVTWGATGPANATLTLNRRAGIAGLLSAGGTANWRVQLQDVTSGVSVTLADEPISTGEAAYASQVLAVDPSFVKQGHSYRVNVRTILSAAVALLGGVNVNYDDVTLNGSTAGGDPLPMPVNGSDLTTAGGATGSQISTSNSSTSTDSSSSTSAATKAAAALARTGAVKLTSKKLIRFTPRKAVTLQVSARAAGKPVGRLVVKVRTGKITRSVITNAKGIARFRLTPKKTTAVVFTAGTAKVSVKVQAKAKKAAKKR